MRIWKVFILFLFWVPASEAASFDCKKAGTAVEKLICSDAHLSSADEDIAALYKELRGKLSTSAKDALKAEQRAWLKTRNQELCSEIYSCLLGHYQRIIVLKKYVEKTSLPQQAAGTIQTYLQETDQAYQNKNYLDEEVTWLPEIGIRGLYLHSRITPLILEQLSGVPVFLSGPHVLRFNFSSDNTFGHYNPQFVEWLKHTFGVIQKDPTLKEVGQKLFVHLRGQARAAYRMYFWVHAPERQEWFGQTKAKYIQLMAEKKLGGDALSYPEDELVGLWEWAEQEQLDAFEAYSGGKFWFRRSIDGTDQQFFELLKDIMQTYDGFYASVWEQ